MKTQLFVLISIMGLAFLFCGVVEKLANKDPIIKSVTANPPQISVNDTTTLKVEAEDPDGDILAYRWESGAGGQFISTTGAEVQWIAPSNSGRFQIKIKVTDENGGKATGEVFVNVRGNESPIVNITQPVENEIIPGLGRYTIKVDISFTWRIDRVDLFVNKDSIFSDNTKPYEWSGWEVTSLSGRKTIIAKAYEEGSPWNYGVDSVHVTIEGIVPLPKR